MTEWQPVLCHDGVHLAPPTTVSFAAGPDLFLQVAAALTAAGEPAVHVGLFNRATGQHASTIATPAEGAAIAAAVLAQVAVAEERWGRQ